MKGLITALSLVTLAVKQPATSTVINESSIGEVIATTTSKEEINKVLATVFPDQAERDIMRKVALCESRLYHEIDGEVVRGKVNSNDRGLFQINTVFHEKQAERLGYDIHTIEGNARYAKYLFDKNGLRDWDSSKRCWSAYFKR